MKKLSLFLVVSLTLLSCVEHTLEKYGEDKTQEQLYKEAEEMHGISVVQIGDTEKEVSEKLKKHHSKFIDSFDTYKFLFMKNSDRSMVHLSDIGIHESTSDEYHNKDYADILKSVTVIISDEFKIDLRLMFFKDTLRSIIVLNNEEKVRWLFKDKYGEGKGYSDRYDRMNLRREKLVYAKEHSEVVWENKSIIAEYKENFEMDVNSFRDDASFIIKSKSIPEQEIKMANDSLYKMRQMSEQDKKDKLIDAI